MSALFAPSTPRGPVPWDHGRFTWEIARGHAVWSDSVYQLHGYEAGEILPSVALAFSHKHPDDLHGCVDALHAGMLMDRLVVHEHRLLDLQGEERRVVMIARGRRDADGRVQTLHGFLLRVGCPELPPLDGAPGRSAAALVGAIRTTFGVSEAAARVLLSSRRSTGSAPTTPRTVVDPGGQLRRSMADAMFPLEHLLGR
jgi:hypothetical protein